MKKKTILWHSNYAFAKTGLGRNTKSVLEYLFKTNKYKIINYAQGMPYSHPDFQRYPYDVIGCLPTNQHEIDQINRDPNYARACSYGAYYIDKVIKEHKPDVAIFSDDWWAFSGYYDKPWWNKFNCVFHITLDSIPILKEARDNANKIKNYFVWTDFATKEMNRLGFNHVKTRYGAVDNKSFYRLGDQKRAELRVRHKIPQDAFVFGFVFRNQLRKEVLPLMRAFKEFNKTHSNSYLLLHTNLTEGWDINRACEEYDIDKSKIITTYICKNCKEIEIRPVGLGQDLDCRFCGAQKSQISCNVIFGATEDQLNEVYNLMDGYFQLANAGGFEIPLVEALYAELPSATMSYSFGEAFVGQDFIFEVDWSKSFQIGTMFERACPSEFSIQKVMNKMFDLKIDKRRQLGKSAREWAVSKFSPEVVGKEWEAFIDSLPEVDYDYEFDKVQKNPSYNPPEITDDAQWIIDIYKNILNMTVNDQDSGFLFWLQKLKNGGNRNDILNYFKQVAAKDIEKSQKVNFESLLDDGTDNDRIALVMKESMGDVFMITSLLPSLAEKYPKDKIYVFTDPKFFEIFDGNPYVYKVLPWMPEVESQPFLEGRGAHKGYFKRAFLPFVGTQRHLDYLFRGSSDMISFDIYSKNYNKYSV